MTTTQDFLGTGRRTRPLSAGPMVATQYPKECLGPACGPWVLVVPLTGPLNKRGRELRKSLEDCMDKARPFSTTPFCRPVTAARDGFGGRRPAPARAGEMRA